MRKVLLLFVALFMATIANAQISPITFGPKVGYQTTKLSLKEDAIKSDFKGNMTFGLFGRLTIKKFVLQPEVLFFKSGKVFETSLLDNNGGLIPDINPKISINQLNMAVPVFVGCQFVDIPLLKMRANVGPVFYFALGKAEYSMDGQSIDPKIDSSENMTLGGAVNLGIDIWKLTLDVNYSLGLTNVFDGNIKVAGQEFTTGNNTKQNIFTVTLGFKIL